MFKIFRHFMYKIAIAITYVGFMKYFENEFVQFFIDGATTKDFATNYFEAVMIVPIVMTIIYSIIKGVVDLNDL